MQTAVMTGATRGIGREALRRIIAADPEVTIVLLARAGADISWVRDEAGAGVVVHRVDIDMGSMAATRTASQKVAAMVEAATIAPITALVLNAGVQHVDDLHTSADGLEDTFAVNVVANHILVRALAPHVQPGGRIVITVSDTHFGDLRHNLSMVPGPHWQDAELLARPGTMPEPASVGAGRTAYSTSKLAAIHQVHEYARQYPHLSVLAYNPGFVPGTGLARDAGPASRFAMAHLLPLLTRTPIASSVQDAGANLADLATTDRTLPTGSYVNRGRAEKSSAQSYAPHRERELIGFLDHLVQWSPPDA